MSYNGAEALLKTLIDSGVEVCFANPGTSEMQLVAAIDKIPGMRPVLGLFEGVVTGAADGYGRMAGRPAATLLHLGSGFSNGMANLHNAKRAHTPIVNIIGEHAVDHIPLDAPLTSDIQAHAGIHSDWTRTCRSADTMAQDAAEAVAAAMAGRQVNLIVPANYAWTEAGDAAAAQAPEAWPKVSDEQLSTAAEALKKGSKTCLFVGGKALREEGLELAHRIASATGAKVICEVFPARIQRGRGRFAVERLPYLGEFAAAVLEEFEAMVVVGTKAPVSFFAYPEKPSVLTPEDCQIHSLASAVDDQLDALQRLVELLQAPKADLPEPAELPVIPGPDQGFTAEVVGAIVAHHLPEQAIVSDEANTSGIFSYGLYDGAAPHDWLTLTGGAIGQGMPVAVGAAIACPERQVISLQADGSAMYTNQSLWSMAREKLDVIVVIFNNASYAILNMELHRVGVTSPGPRAQSMLSLNSPTLDWVKMAQAQGVNASRASNAVEFEQQFCEALAQTGPRLIEVML